MVNRIGHYPRVHAGTSGDGVVSQAGGVALVETVCVARLDRVLSAALSRRHRPMVIHDPAKVITDLAIALALGGDCLADVTLLRAGPWVFGQVASDPTVSRSINVLAADAKRALAAIDSARAAARARVRRLSGARAPDHDISADRPLITDTDATLITAHSDKEQAAPAFKRGLGFHPLLIFAGHGGEGTGEPLACLLRKGNAGSNTDADHIAVVKAALAQLPGHRPGRKILIRVDGAGAMHQFLGWLISQRL